MDRPTGTYSEHLISTLLTLPSSTALNNVYETASANFDSTANILSANFLAYYGVILSIWAVEAVRGCNALMPVQLYVFSSTLISARRLSLSSTWLTSLRPILFTLLARKKGLGVAAPLYFFVHWVLTPIDTFKSTDMRLTKLHYTRAILPSLLTVYYLPLAQSYLLPEVGQKETWLQLWQYFPVTLSLAQFVISKFWKDTADQDKIERPKRDIATLRYTIGVPAGVSMMLWLYTLFVSPASVSQIFLPQDITTSLVNLNSTTSSFNIAQWDHLITISATYLWLLYFIWDAKVAGMVSHSWIAVLAVMTVATTVLGPGGAVGAGFLWREYIVAEKRHKGALTSEEKRQRIEGRGQRGKEQGHEG